MNPDHQEACCAVVPALNKLIDVVEEENLALGRQQIMAHAGYTDRKNQALRELMAAQRRESHGSVLPHLRVRLERLAVALGENGRLLKLHIAAVGEISDIIVGGLRDAESDGTYTRSSGPRGR